MAFFIFGKGCEKIMKKLIGIDIGTTHCKAIAMTEEGKVVYERKSVYEFKDSEKAQSEQDVELIYEAVIGLLGDATKDCVNNEIAAVTFSSAMHGLVAVDANNNPLTPLYTWAHNGSIKQAENLAAGENAIELRMSTGTPIHPMSPLCKIMWLREEKPDIFSRTSKFISAKEFIFYKLFGKYIIDHSIASATGLFDIATKNWNNKALKIAGISEEMLSTPVSPLHYENGFKTLPDVPFVIGASDGCLANLGGGVMESGQASLTIGTSGAIRITTKERVLNDKRLFNYILSDPYYICGGPVNNGGNVVKWFMENFYAKKFTSAEDLDWLTKKAESIPPGSAKLLFLPYIFGERSPVWDARATGAFIGLNGEHTLDHMARSVFEGIFFGLREILTAIEENGIQVGEIHASGAFVNSSFLMQCLSNVMNKPVIISEYSDASVIGACFLGMNAVGMRNNFNHGMALNKDKRSYLPDGAVSAVYEEMFALFRSIYPAFKGIIKGK